MAKHRTIITLDAETDPFNYGDFPTPFVWGIFDGENFNYFWGDEEKIKIQLMNELSQYPEGTIVYAHNGGKFDYHFLLECLDSELMIVNGRIAKATILNGQIELRDSYMLIPIPLGQYDKFYIDYNKFTKENRENNKNEIIRYLRKDCEALFQLVDSFISRFGLNLTVAGTALKELKKTGYQVSRTSLRYDTKFRRFYYGGRVQVFKAGSFYASEKPFIYADINSAYSKAMIQSHWHGESYFSETKLPDDKNKIGVCLIKLDAISRGCLPFRGEDNKLYFPDDDNIRTYHVTGWEVLAGLETNTLEIKKIVICYRPVLTESFSTYIKKWFDEKAEAKGVDQIKYLFAKLMQNSPYGKMGQDGRNFCEFCLLKKGEWPELIKNNEGEPLPLDHDDQWQLHSDTETGYSFFKRSNPSDRFFNVPIAASITGWVRAYLWRHIHASKGVMYCDTDSIICEEFIGDVGPELGQWEIEARFSEVHIAQRKMYAGRVENHSKAGAVNKIKVASKGVNLCYDAIKNGIENGDIVEHERDAPTYSVRFGSRFVKREIDLKNIQKNTRKNPPNNIQ